jgi:hypothetical protein
VPIPGERRLVDGAAQHFTGRLAVSVRRGRRLVFTGESELAALENGDLAATHEPPVEVAEPRVAV